MYRRTLALAAILAAAVAGSAGAADLPVKAVPKKAVETPYFLVNENSVSYHYEFTATNPGAGKTPKNVGTFSHFDVWAYGTNFFNIDWLKATSTQYAVESLLRISRRRNARATPKSTASSAARSAGMN